MAIYLTEIDISGYSSSTQIARLKTEAWVASALFCPNCGSDLRTESNNKQACDFTCSSCTEEFELKSKNGNIGTKIVNGSYSSLVNRLKSDINPNLFVMQYRRSDWTVENFFVVPRYYFTADIIERRNPLSSSARRAGWIGCNILIGSVPNTGRIYYIKDSQIIDRKIILEKWISTQFLDKQKAGMSRTWILEVMNCIERVGKTKFSLADLYRFESQLKEKYPNNSHIKEKIRQKLQILRDNGYLEFVGQGHYRLYRY